MNQLVCAVLCFCQKSHISILSYIVYTSGRGVMCNMGLARVVLIMTRCAHHNMLNTHTLRRTTHNVSSVHTHQYVHTYDCCKHHARRGLHKHTHLDVLYDKLHQHYMLLRIRRHISLCSPILHVTAHQKAINIFSACASQANTTPNAKQVLYIGEVHAAATGAMRKPPALRPPGPALRAHHGAARRGALPSDGRLHSERCIRVVPPTRSYWLFF